MRKIKLQPAATVKIRLTYIGVAIISSAAIIITGMLLILFNVSGSKKAEAAPYDTEQLSAGSYIVNMGITPQTIANGLKPYGLIYDLTKNYNIPVKWVINPGKVKDGVDITVDGISYRGGAFIIPAAYITSAIASRISYWQTQGVQGKYASTDFSAPVYITINFFPFIMIDVLASYDNIIVGYMNNAGIPSTAYAKGTPMLLDQCYDLWVNPHGDPTWETHSSLFNFVTVQKSFIWSQCHAVSVMEAVKNADQTLQLNFLSNNGLRCYNSSKCFTITESHSNNPNTPFAYNTPSDPIMQFMATMDNALIVDGSEKWFIPTSSGTGWRSTTNRVITTNNGTSPKEGVLVTYGPAYGNNSNGWVMYMGGHNLNNSGTVAERVAAQRAFFNFCLLAGKAKEIVVSATSMPSNIQSGQTYPVEVVVSSGIAPYTYQWTSSFGGTFANPIAASTTFTAPFIATGTSGFLTCTVTDACGRKSSFIQPISSVPSPLPVSLIHFKGEAINNHTSRIYWTTASENNNSHFTIEKSADGKVFTNWKRVEGAGNSNAVNNYSLTDVNPNLPITYYRLKQTDFDGNTNLFNVIVVIFKEKNPENEILIFPNPFHNNLNLKIISGEQQDLNIAVYSIVGTQVFKKLLQVQQGVNFHEITELKDLLSEGTYILKIASKEKILKSTRIIFKEKNKEGNWFVN